MSESHAATDFLCPMCKRQPLQNLVLENYRAEVRHDGRLHAFDVPRVPIEHCASCGEQFFTLDSDEAINVALRDHLNLLQPAEIRRQLQLLGIRQKDFAQRIGVAEESVSRWVNGVSIQSRAMDNLMRLFFGLQQVRDTLSSPP